MVGAKYQVCKIGFLLPFLGYFKHFWVKVDKLYLFWEKIENLGTLNAFCGKVGFLWLDLLWHLRCVCVETQWVFWVYLGFLGLGGF